jgi:hypothetical protein
MDQAVMVFDDATERDVALGTAVVSEGMVTYLRDSDAVEVYDSAVWRNIATAATPSYRYVQTVYFTSSGTFTKADYPWLRAIRVRVQAGGGGGGGGSATGLNQGSPGGGGQGGHYAESFITDIAALPSSAPVTVGSGGSGGVGAAGSTGGTSSFNTTLVVANGGLGGAHRGASALPTNADSVSGPFSGTGDIQVTGGVGMGSLITAVATVLGMLGGTGGNSVLGGGGISKLRTFGDPSGRTYGGGGGSSLNDQSQPANTGGAGAPGVVIVELYA